MIKKGTQNPSFSAATCRAIGTKDSTKVQWQPAVEALEALERFLWYSQPPSNGTRQVHNCT